MLYQPWPALGPHRLTVRAEDGVPLQVEVHGPEHSDGTVVLLHGYQLSQRLWGRQVAALRGHHPALRVVTYDHRGHGGSGRTRQDRATIHQLGRDLATVLDQVAPHGPLALVGHSMGGMTVMSYAEHHPQAFGSRVEAVGLISTSAGGLAENDFGVHPRIAALAHRVVPRLQTWSHAQVERGRRQPASPGTRWLLFGKDPDPLDVRRTQQVLDGTPAATAAHFYPTFGDHDRLHAVGPLSAVPVLLACGDRDRITPLAHTRALAAALPHAETVVYPGAGHMLPLERTDDLNRRLVRLLRSLPTAALRAG